MKPERPKADLMGVEQPSVWVYDEATLNPGFVVKATNLNLSLVPQAPFLPTASKPKSIEIPWRPPQTSAALSKSPYRKCPGG
jgi:hypothetical protein